MIRPQVNAERLLGRLDEFARIGATPAGGVNRQALSLEDRAARGRLAEIGAARGFGVFQDEIANLFLRRSGADHTLPPLLIGSHLDSQPTGGRFDGALGVLAALEVLEALEEVGVTTQRPVELVAWTNEEGSRFSPGAMGSQAFRRGSIPADWKPQSGADGALFSAALSETLAALPDAPIHGLGHEISGFIELHIEQGPALEHEGLPIGIVEGVQGTRWFEVQIVGQAAHAGTTERKYRRDPLTAAAQAITRLSDLMQQDPLSRVTVGRILASPGSINSIPSGVTFSLDIRHPDADALRRLEAIAADICSTSAESQGCAATLRRLLEMEPARFSPEIIQTLSECARRLNLPSRRMVSGAFHDALHISGLAPTGMIFVPCRDGLSHNEAEFVEPLHVVTGARMLLEATATMAGAPLVQLQEN